MHAPDCIRATQPKARTCDHPVGAAPSRRIGPKPGNPGQRFAPRRGSYTERSSRRSNIRGSEAPVGRSASTTTSKRNNTPPPTHWPGKHGAPESAHRAPARRSCCWSCTPALLGLYLTPLCAEPFAGPKYLSRVRRNPEISSMSRPTVLSAGGIFRVNDSCQFADKKL